MPALSAVELAPVSLGNLAPNLLAPPRMQYRVLPVAIKAQVTVAPMPATIPAVASSDTTDASSQPPASDGAKPVDMSGTWTMVSGGLGVSCTFQQTGNTLAGTCTTLSQEGPVKGLIDGRKVEWRWLFNGGKVGIIHDFKVAEYKATLLPDNRLEGGYYVYNTYDKFHPSFDYKTSILIPRPPGRYFMAKHAVAPVSAIPTLPAQSAAVQEPAARPVAADGIQPANMTGTWSIFGIPPNQRLRSDVGPPLRPSYCSFRQTGNTLSGTCKNNFFENAVTGSVTGRTVHFDWIYWLGLHPNDNPAFTLRRASFDGTIGPDNVLHGTYKNRFAYRPEPRTPGGTFWAEKQPSDPS
jgi:hypothetical protein